MATARTQIGIGIANDQAVADALQLQPCRIDYLAAELGITKRCVGRCFKRLRARGIGIVVVGADPVRMTRTGLTTKSLYRIGMPRGRVCAHEGCGTVLRTTNPSERCELHGGGVLELEAAS